MIRRKQTTIDIENSHISSIIIEALEKQNYDLDIETYDDFPRGSRLKINVYTTETNK